MEGTGGPSPVGPVFPLFRLLSKVRTRVAGEGTAALGISLRNVVVFYRTAQQGKQHQQARRRLNAREAGRNLGEWWPQANKHGSCRAVDSGDVVVPGVLVLVVLGMVVVDDGSEEAEQGQNQTLSRRQGKKGRK